MGNRSRSCLTPDRSRSSVPGPRTAVLSPTPPRPLYPSYAPFDEHGRPFRLAYQLTWDEACGCAMRDWS
jgi:hypothetical protein